jgi:CubicO group peptidase (beta-lactamase class C family)
MSSGLLSDLQGYVEGLIEKHSIPALSLAVWHSNTLNRAASGILNIETGVEATVDSLFQIGSISKVFTASLIMLLVDQGKVDLDRPVKRYLPNFHVADPQGTETITLRHLLSHTSGLVSDYSFRYEDADDGGNAIARYVDRCFLLPQVHKDIGKRFSYSNAAHVIAGRVVEVVSGVSWRQAVEDWIFKPLNMTQAVASPIEVLRFRAAMGHLLSGSAKNTTVTIASRCYSQLGRAPSGSVMTMSASDLLKFAKAHWSGGMAESGARWMSQKSIAGMQEVQIDLPAPSMLWQTNWGVGWAITDCQGAHAYGHGGGTIGQQALLQIIPDAQFAFSLQLNGMRVGGAPVLQEVYSDMLFEICGVRPEKSKPAVDTPQDSTVFLGDYGGSGFNLAVTREGEQLLGRVEVEGLAAFPAQTFDLKPVGKNRFAAYSQDGEKVDDFTFVELDKHGTPRYLFFGDRLHGRRPAS